MKNVLLVGMNEVNISSIEHPIIGTRGLVFCIGFILYNKELKKAIVGHISPDQLIKSYVLKKPIMISLDICGLLDDNGLLNKEFDLTIIKGAYESNYIIDNLGLTKLLELKLKEIPYMKIDNIIYDNNKEHINTVDINGCESTTSSDLSNEFAFDSLSGNFVTNIVDFDNQSFDNVI